MSVEDLFPDTKPQQKYLIDDIKDAIDIRCQQGKYTNIEVVGALVWCILDEYAERWSDEQE